MVWAFGSLLAGVVTGGIAWRAAPATRFRIGATALAAVAAAAAVRRQPASPVAVLLLVSGLAIAPTLIASVAVIEASVPQSRLTEALSWTITGHGARARPRVPPPSGT